MKREIFAGICILSATSFLPGCLNSEEDYNNLTEEVAKLSAEMDATSREEEILKQALENIEREKERLLSELRPYEPGLSEADASAAPDQAGGSQTGDASAAPAAPPSGGVHVAQRGDTLSNIAIRYNTDMHTLLNLNPYLARRNDYMVWENDNIILPGGAPAPAVPAPDQAPAAPTENL